MQELVQRVLVVAPHDLDPRVVAGALDHRADVGGRLFPQLVGALAALVFGQLIGQAVRTGGRFGGSHADAADVDQALWVAHHERPQLEPEVVAVLEGQVVRARDAHRAGLGIEPRRKLAQRVDAATDAVLRLQHDRLVALPAQLVSGHQAGHSAADDQYPLAFAGALPDALLGDVDELLAESAARCLDRAVARSTAAVAAGGG